MRPRPELDPDRPTILWEEIKDLSPANKLTMARDFRIIMPEVNELDIKLSSSEKLTRARAEIAAQDKADNKE